MLNNCVISFLLSIFISTTAVAGMRVGVGVPSASIGINVASYPEMGVVQGYPIYYAPRLSTNLFFYDGYYWLYQNDSWYVSAWYNGLWFSVGPESMPAVLLQVPVRYYHAPPRYFLGWQLNAAPRWDDHWGRDWSQQRKGWDKYSHAQTIAPLPSYQRRYSGERYPQHSSQQLDIHERHYNYQPHDQTQRRLHPENPLPHDEYKQKNDRAQKQYQEQRNIQASKTERPDLPEKNRVEANVTKAKGQAGDRQN